ncbi:MAG TPA: hypothetical protein H9701_01940, partial [Candidatus Intestinimonas pullistercoris]|nr:hypothetical protein [Candidatus Intestinimonas pullistercoris]
KENSTLPFVCQEKYEGESGCFYKSFRTATQRSSGDFRALDALLKERFFILKMTYILCQNSSGAL